MSTADRDVPGPADFALGLVRLYVTGHRAPDPPDEPFYQRRAACFVTLKMHGQLRGCIGTLEPAEASLGREIERNAFSSALRDPRFPPVTSEEIDALTCSVDVLSESEPCSVEDLDPKVYGVIVESGFKRGVLLPALEGVDTVEQQVGIALQKAGIAPDRGFDVRRFRVTRYREGDPAAELDAGAPGPVCE
ncbi:MAG TPA: AmmeMemoRadiSam system protein A [Thermoleophilia bacterium]|nr:AmmeMemoRadiSam system protein A [Thermoleophilia bacterium]